jgi:hypothetical protein
VPRQGFDENVLPALHGFTDIADHRGEVFVGGLLGDGFECLAERDARFDHHRHLVGEVDDVVAFDATISLFKRDAFSGKPIGIGFIELDDVLTFARNCLLASVLSIASSVPLIELALAVASCVCKCGHDGLPRANRQPG